MTNETAAAAETAGQVEILPPERPQDLDSVRAILAGELAEAHKAIVTLVVLIRSPHTGYSQTNMAAQAAGQLMRGTAALALALAKLSGETPESRQRISLEYLNHTPVKAEGAGGGVEI